MNIRKEGQTTAGKISFQGPARVLNSFVYRCQIAGQVKLQGSLITVAYRVWLNKGGLALKAVSEDFW